MSPIQPKLIYRSCPLCGLDRLRVVFRESTYYFNTPLTMNIVQCCNCSMVYTNPRLAEENITYEKQDYITPEYVRFHTFIKGKVFRNALARLRFFRPPPAFLIDVGSGIGSFLVQVRKSGYNVLGIEPSRANVKYASEQSNLSIREGHFESLSLEGIRADILTMWDVLEHIAEPRKFIKSAKKVLKPGGIIVLRFPGETFQRIKSIFLRLIKGNNAVIYSPVIHLNFFSHKTIRRLLCEEGFEIIAICTTTSEGRENNGFFNIIRFIWSGMASLLAKLTGIYIDNIEVYARSL